MEFLQFCALTILISTGLCQKIDHGLDYHGNLRVIDNGYEGLIISISDEVPEDYCNQVLSGLKKTLKNFSKFLKEATEGQLFLRETNIILPESWHTSTLTCSLTQPITIYSSASPAHITVSNSHPLFGSQPFAQQSQGCGKPGDFINIGADVFRGAANDTYSNTARLLLSEWAKFRWGVYEEKGHEGDNLYPPYYRNAKNHHWEATGCFNGKVYSSEPECDPSMHGCRFSPKSYSNEHITTSLLSYPQISSVTKFCKSHNHNQNAPTKHNALCGGRSTWEIIEQSQDFAGVNFDLVNNASLPEPIIKYSKKGKTKYVLVIEDTASMNLQRRWEFLRKAVRRVVVYDIPDNSHVSIVSFNSVARTVSKLTYVGSGYSDMRQKVGSSLPRNPSTVPESQKCILCGIQEGLRTLDEDKVYAEGAIFILVTSGAGTSTHHQMNEMTRLINERSIRIMLIQYPITERLGSSSLTSAEELIPLVNVGLRGRSFTVMDEGVGNDSKVSMLMSLMNALFAAVQLGDHPGRKGSPVMVHRDSYPGGIASMSTGSFALDDSVGPNARFSVYYYDINHVGNKIQLTAPSGDTPFTIQEEDGDVNMIFVELDNAERGLWTYTVENRADSHQGLYVQVTAKKNSTKGMNVKLWVSSGTNSINASDPSNPVIIYAELTDNRAPVLNANVVAKLQRLGTNATGSTYDPIYIDLRDNGNGDPDITEGDGIYSRYFPQLHRLPGKYILSAKSDYNNGMALIVKESSTRHHKSPAFTHYFYQYNTHSPERTCCGSSLAKTHTKRAPPFQRHMTWGVIDVIHAPAAIDITPPSRILDLEINVNNTVYEVNLKWTAPGDDFDFGRAAKFEAVVAPSWRQARDFQGNELANLPVPLTAGSHHTTTLRFTRYEELWYIAIRAVDDMGNRGGVGNIATLWVPRPPTTYEITTRTQPGLTTSGNVTTVSQELGLTRHVGFSEFSPEVITVILGAAGGFIIVVVLIGTYCIISSRRRHKQHAAKDVEKCRNTSVIVKSNSCQGGLNESVDSMDGIKEPESVQGTRSLSPVQSWGATTLIQEHERRLSVNSGCTREDNLIAYQPDASCQQNAYPPDVTVTNRRDCVIPSPTQTSGHEPPPYDPPPYSTYPGDDDNRCPCGPGPEYNGYPTNWDDHLSNHLLSRSHAGTPNPQNPQINIADRKRRNVTQV